MLVSCKSFWYSLNLCSLLEMICKYFLPTCDFYFHCCCWVASAVSNSVRPQRQQPTRLPHPWDSPGKNTGVGSHFLLQYMKVKSESEVAQSCPTLPDPMDGSPPSSFAHGIFQARDETWVNSTSSSRTFIVTIKSPNLYNWWLKLTLPTILIPNISHPFHRNAWYCSKYLLWNNQEETNSPTKAAREKKNKGFYSSYH